MAERFRVCLLLFATLLPGLAAGLEYVEWSWQEGLVGDYPEGDVYGSGPGHYPGYFCDDCRDPAEYPMDFAAFAYNGYWGDDPWMLSSQLGMPFRIYNAEMQWVAAWFEQVLFGAPLSLLPDTMDVLVRLETGQVLTFTVIQGGPDLPVGSQEPYPDARTTTGSCTCADGAAGGEADDDYVEPDEFELPWVQDEVSGTVEIIDPEEDGEFPPWEEEL